jgi:hypothetical protein
VFFGDPFPWREDARGKFPSDDVSFTLTDDEAIRLLEKAGALCAAEIDRLLRKKEKKL